MPKQETTQKPKEQHREKPGEKPKIIKDTASVTQNTHPQTKRTKTDYVELAKERNARVILHNTPDTYPLTDMARYADQGIRRLRNRIMISLAPKDALPLLDEYNESLIKLHTIIAKICAMTNVRYRTPRALLQMLGEDAPEETDLTGDPPDVA